MTNFWAVVTGKMEKMEKFAKKVGCRPPGGNVRQSRLYCPHWRIGRRIGTPVGYADQSPGGTLTTFIPPK